MRIDSTNNMNNANTVRMGMQARMGQGMDAASKNIQNQIQTKQQELQKLSESEDMSPEDKMKKRQEIQQEISDLNIQLRQRQIEQRREQQSKGQSCDDVPGGKQAQKKSQNGHGGNAPKANLLSQTSMKAMISADSSMKQAAIQGGVATRMQGRANVLKAEIKQSGSTEAKEAELADLEQKAVNATAAQMNTLAEANETVREAAVAERTEKKSSDTKETQTKEKTEKTADSGAKGEKAQKGISSTGAQTGKTENVQQDNGAQVQNIQSAETAPPEAPATQAAVYTHVDVRL